MCLYTAFGLCIQSELAIPELPVAQNDAVPQVIVRLGNLDLSETMRQTKARSFVVETEVGKYLINGEQEIVIDPAPGIEEATIRLYLLGPTFAVLLRLRGFLVFHGSAVAVNNSVVTFLGDAGWGKSTLAEAFLTRGHTFVTDDVLAIRSETNQPMILPTFPQVKLWPEAAAGLGFAPETLPQLHSQVLKRAHRFTDGFSQIPLPLKRIYVLGPVSSDHEIKSLQSQEAFVHLVRHSRNVPFPSRPDLDILHFHQCAKLIKQIPVCLLKRQNSLNALPSLVSLIEEDLADSNA